MPLMVLLLCLLITTVSHAATFTVTPGGSGCSSGSSTNALQTCLSSASVQPGDEVVLTNGTYTATTYVINGTNGTSANRITLRAQNRHAAILDGPGGYNTAQHGIQVQRAWWRIADLEIKEYTFGVTLEGGADNTLVEHNLIHTLTANGISFNSGNDNSIVRNNVVAFGDDGDNQGYWGAVSGNTSNGATIENNALYSFVRNAYLFAQGCCPAGGWEMNMVATNNWTIRGNIIMDGPKAAIRLTSGNLPSALPPFVENNIIDSNIIAHSQTGVGIGENANFNEVTNNFFYSVWFNGPQAKGNINPGQNIFSHNTMILTDYARTGVFLDNVAGADEGGWSEATVHQNNLTYRKYAFTGNPLVWVYCPSCSIATTSHNLFWSAVTGGSGDTVGWNRGGSPNSDYVYAATDIHSDSQRPIFVDEPNGDFSLAAGSPGKGTSSEGGASATPDRGMNYNAYLTKQKVQHIVQMDSAPWVTDQNTGGATSLAFAGVQTNTRYQVYTYIPISGANSSLDTFVIEGQSSRPLFPLPDCGTGCMEEPHRWIWLGTFRSTDGTLNVQWTFPGSASKIRIRRMPTPAEAYIWITETANGVPNAPTNLRIVSP
jgi:hypothetical protein